MRCHLPTLKKCKKKKFKNCLLYIVMNSTYNNLKQNLTLENQSLQELQKMKDERMAKSKGILDNIENSAKGIAVNALESVGNKLGVNIEDPQSVNNALNNIKKAVTDPENIKKTTEILKGLAQNAAVYYKAVEPLVNPMADKMLEVGAKTAEKMGETATVIASNAVKEIPGVGLAYALVQDASKLGEAASAATNAFAELTTTASDSAVVFKKNLEKLKAEKAAIEARTKESLNQFENPIMKNLNNNTLVGGKRKSYKRRVHKRTNKTKKRCRK